MPIETPLNVSPYFDDHDPTKNYHKVLIKPGVSIQVRELNEMQTIFQEQIERLGNNLFVKGTIIDGCNFVFYESYPYVKLKDVNSAGDPIIPGQYVGYILENESSGVRAYIRDFADGFESSDPDLKTLYIRYMNSGDDANTFSFSSGDVLKISDIDLGVWGATINNGGVAFSNSDQLVVTSALIVNVSTGAFINGEYITNSFLANVQIVGIDTVTFAETNQVVLSIAPRNIDLANSLVTQESWTISNGDAITDISATTAAVVEGVIGSGLQGSIITNGVGRITSVVLISTGNGYTLPPTLRVQSSNNVSGIAALDITAKNYLDVVSVATVANAVGNGYAFGVSEGIIYQKGHFVRVPAQTTVIEKYNQAPNAVAVGFVTEESIVDSTIDPDLLDNSFTTRNINAPGADRLQLTPRLLVLPKTDSDGNSSFFSIVEWSEGNAYKQKQFTQYAKIGDAIAKGIFDTAGNFVKDSFLLTSRSPLDDDFSAEFSSLVIDPGVAYVEGRDITTHRNFVLDVRNGTDSIQANNQTVSLSYGNYLQVANLAGVFQFNTGDTVDLYDTPKNYYANADEVAVGNTNPAGSKIGTAHIRSLVRDAFIPDTWRLYVFNVQMNQGRNFTATKSVHYNGTLNDGIADVIQTPSVLSGTNATQLQQPLTGGLVFYSGARSLKNSSNNTYNYRTIDQSLTTANTGLITKNISADPDEFFPSSGELSGVQLQDIMVIPQLTMIQNSALTGTVAMNNTIANVVGTGTAFLSDFAVGDYIYLFSNADHTDVRKITSIVNNEFLTIDKHPSAQGTNAVATYFRAFPKNVPVPFGIRSGLTGNVDGTGQILTLNFGMRFGFSGTSNTTVATTIQRRGVDQLTKTANRSKFIKINPGTNPGGVNGPWAMGVPDVFRIRNVYLSSNSTVNTDCRNVISSFYVDNNQLQDYLDLSWLYLKPKAAVELKTGDYLLVEFDYFTTPPGGGFCDALSYVSSNSDTRFHTDSLPLANLNTEISSWEVPLMKMPGGTSVDFLSVYDFRPQIANTVQPDSDPDSAPLNPANTQSFGDTSDPDSEKKFPYPDSAFTADVEKWVGRVDAVFVNSQGLIFAQEGPVVIPTRQTLATLPTPPGTMKISDVLIPGYPTLPAVRNQRLLEIMNTGVANKGWLKMRIKSRTITQPKASGTDTVNQPRVYTMEDIAKIDLRLKNVEYYVAMNTLESDLAKRNIPSSIDPTMDRFKYGFFVDDFHDYLNLDTTNPNFAAIVEDDDLVPEKMQWAIPFQLVQGPGEFVDFPLSNQDNATMPPNPPTCIPPSNVVTEYFLLQQTQGQDFQIQKTFANSASQGAFYISVVKGALYTIDIRQYRNPTDARIDNGNLSGGTHVGGFDSPDPGNHLNLTATDRTFLVSNTVQNWFGTVPSTILTSNFHTSGNGIGGSMKFVWNYNPTNGRHVVVSVLSNSPTGAGVQWKAVLAAPIDNTQVGCLVDTPNTISIVPPPQIIRITGCMNGWQSAAMDLDDLSGSELSTFDKLTDFEGSGSGSERYFVVQSGGIPTTTIR